MFDRLVSWGFTKISKNDRVWEAKLGELHETRWAVWSFWLNKYGFDLNDGFGGLGATYIPASEKGFLLETIIPNTMDYETHMAIRKVRSQIGGNIFEYVKTKLQYDTDKELEDALATEQIDAVALAIYNIEERKQSIILADQTGVGKGRVGAGIIRYTIKQGKVPIFITEKSTLFSDMFRDLRDTKTDQSEPRYISNGGMEQKIKYDTWESLSDDDKEIYLTKEDYQAFCQENPTEMGFKMVTNPKYREVKGNMVVPFILNGKEAKTEIKGVDVHGNDIVFYDAMPNTNGQKKEIIAKCDDIREYKNEHGNQYNCIFATYSQFSSDPSKANKKKDKSKYTMSDFGLKSNFLFNNCENAILILDECHNAGGIQSKVGVLFTKFVAPLSKGIIFISATFAKKPDNFPLFVSKTVMSESTLDSERFIATIIRGGGAIQEILSAQLVAEGQLLRRERSNEGVQVIETFLEEHKELHTKICDNVTEIFRDVIEFQKQHIDGLIDKLDTEKKEQLIQEIEAGAMIELDNKVLVPEITNINDEDDGSISTKTRGTSELGVSNAPMFSRTFNLVNQLLFSLKADAVADMAIKYLKEGKKPVIAFSSTMGSFLQEMGKPNDYIDGDFSQVLEKTLKTVLKYTVTSATGEKDGKYIELSKLSQDGQDMYDSILEKIRKSSIGISISPIDVIREKIESAGFSVAEVTGRNIGVSFRDGAKKLKDNNQPHDKTYGRIYTIDSKLSNTDKFKKFNYNEIDCLLINQSGSTGASAQAKAYPPIVPAEKVKQRVMITLQNELNINTEIQKRGRIHRTGQILPPIYNIVCSEIPAEKRLQIMLQSKLKSLDANTTSNQKTNKETVGSVVDFINKYGDEVVSNFMEENEHIHEMIGSPLGSKEDANPKLKIQDASRICSSRVAILSVEMQAEYYDAITANYLDYEARLLASGDYDLEVKHLDLQAITRSSNIYMGGSGGSSLFGQETIKEICEVNNLDKPYKAEQVADMIEKYKEYELHKGKTPREINNFYKEKAKEHFKTLNDDYKTKAIVRVNNLIDNIESDLHYKKLVKKIKNGEEPESALAEYKQLRTNAIRTEANTAYGKYKQKAKELEFKISANLSKFQVGSTYGIPSEMNEPKFVFLGCNINMNAKNPFAPSAVKFKFAVCNYTKGVEYSLVPESAILLNQIVRDERISLDWFTEERWTDQARNATLDRVDRAILTGNIIQAFLSSKGKLISYTCKDGSMKKGILLHSIHEDGDSTELKGYVSVPIKRLYDYIENVSIGSKIMMQEDIELHHKQGYYEMRVPKKAKTYISDMGLVNICSTPNEGFQSVGNNFVARFYDLDMLISSLSVRKFSVLMPKAQYNQYFNSDLEEIQLQLQTESDFKAKYEFEDDKENYPKRLDAQRKRLADKPKKESSNLYLLRLKAESELEIMEMEMEMNF